MLVCAGCNYIFFVKFFKGNFIGNLNLKKKFFILIFIK
jgi:hypothetical protein